MEELNKETNIISVCQLLTKEMKKKRIIQGECRSRVFFQIGVQGKKPRRKGLALQRSLSMSRASSMTTGRKNSIPKRIQEQVKTPQDENELDVLQN